MNEFLNFFALVWSLFQLVCLIGSIVYLVKIFKEKKFGAKFTSFLKMVLCVFLFTL